MTPVLITGVVEHILNVPSAYPGPHNASQERTDPSMLPLEPKKQLLSIWECMCGWIQEQLMQGNGVTAKTFGSFTFERGVKQLRPLLPELNHVGKEVETLVPRFVMAPDLAAEVHKHPSKDLLEKNHTRGSIFQTKNMKFLNPVPIAAQCSLNTPVVASALKAFFTAILQLVRNGYDLTLDFSFCAVKVANRKLSCKFAVPFKQKAQATIDSKRANRPTPVKSHWNCCKEATAMALLLQGDRVPGEADLQAAGKSLPHLLDRSKRHLVDDLSHVSALTVSRRCT